MARRQSRQKQRRSRRYGGDEAPPAENKSFIDNIFGSDDAPAPAAPAAPAEPAPAAAAAASPAVATPAVAEDAPAAPAPEEAPATAMTSFFGTDKPAKKKRSSRRRCKCYTPKKLKSACKRMRSRRRRRNTKTTSMRPATPVVAADNTFTNMYAAPPVQMDVEM